MCFTCKPLRTYEKVNNYDQLSLIKEEASSLVNEGIFEVLFEYNDDSYHETTFHCKTCGKTHILWMVPDLCGTGGEWRQI